MVNRRLFQISLLALLLSALVGCAESERQQATGKGTIRGLNAAVSAPGIVFLLEERPIPISNQNQVIPINFKNVTPPPPVEFDDLSYVANFDYTFFGDTEPTRLASVPFDLVRDHDHLFVFTGSLATPSATLWERPIRDWDGTETVIEVAFGHLSPQLGEVDVYFAAPGTVPVLGAALATLTNGNRSNVLEVAAGEYQLIITSGGNPADALFSSETFDYAAAENYLLAIFDGDPSLTSPTSVRRITVSVGSVELINTAAAPSLRTFHAAFGTGAVDLYRDDDFSAPLIANIGYGMASAPVPSVAESRSHTFTEAGNVGAVLLDQEFGILASRFTTRFLVGAPASLTSVEVTDDFRPLEDSTKLRFIQTSANQSSVDIYVVQQGTDINDVNPFFFGVASSTAAGSSGSTGYISRPENTYEVYATTPGTKDVLAGPVAFSAVDGDVVHFALIDTADPNVLEFVEYDHRSVVR